MKLIESNLRALEQGRAMLSLLDDVAYAHPAPHTNGIRIGAHMRHVIEFYECFLEGVAAGSIDYDARRRNPAIEKSRAAALRAIGDIERKLSAVSGEVVRVRSEELVLASSVARELQVLLDHTIHHYALIAVALHAIGVSGDPEFGVARSTSCFHAAAGSKAA